MMFSCLPHDNEHEWCNLRDFVNQYSELYGKAYRVVAFPELDNRNTKEPEVLLEVSGGRNPRRDRAQIGCAATGRSVYGQAPQRA